MSGHRLPGPLSQTERPLLIRDGTECNQPATLPGPQPRRDLCPMATLSAVRVAPPVIAFDAAQLIRFFRCVAASTVFCQFLRSANWRTMKEEDALKHLSLLVPTKMNLETWSRRADEYMALEKQIAREGMVLMEQFLRFSRKGITAALQDIVHADGTRKEAARNIEEAFAAAHAVHPKTKGVGAEIVPALLRLDAGPGLLYRFAGTPGDPAAATESPVRAEVNFLERWESIHEAMGLAIAIDWSSVSRSSYALAIGSTALDRLVQEGLRFWALLELVAADVASMEQTLVQGLFVDMMRVKGTRFETRKRAKNWLASAPDPKMKRYRILHMEPAGNQGALDFVRTRDDAPATSTKKKKGAGSGGPPPLPPRRTPEQSKRAAKVEPPEQPTLAPNVNPALQAKTLQEAHAAGAFFCEECKQSGGGS